MLGKNATLMVLWSVIVPLATASAETYDDVKRWGLDRPNLVKRAADANSADDPLVQPGECETQTDGTIVCRDAAAAGGGRDQSLQFGDTLAGTGRNDVQIGGLGTDVLWGRRGDDVQIGGLEHFFPLNRDRAFGGYGDDVFLWKPGDGSDAFFGGRGTDVVVFGNIGEPDGDGVAFRVETDRRRGEVFIAPDTGLPLVDVSGSPGFCDVIDASTTPQSRLELEELGLDQLVRFTIRGVAAAFERGDQDTDNGLRVTLHLKDVELLVCTRRTPDDYAAQPNIEILDLRWSPPRPVDLDEVYPRRLRERLEAMIF